MAKPPTLDEAEKAQWLRKLNRATSAHEKARRHLEEVMAGARSAGVSLTEISAHTPYSREWVRRITTRVATEQAPGDE